MVDPSDVLKFWFGELEGPESYPEKKALKWFNGGRTFDEEIAERFGGVLERAIRGGLRDWEDSPRDRLALIVVLDQFSRNLYRGTPMAFAQDERAIALTRDAIAKGWDGELLPVERVFLYMPLMHAESAEAQAESVAVFRRLVEEAPPSVRMAFDVNLDFAEQHKAIIDRFGRYPHRNEILGRESTPAEIAFLKEPGSSF